MDHVAFRMPVLVLSISEYFNELFQDRGLTAAASLGELGRVMVMAINLAIMLIIAVLSTEYCWAKGAGEVIDVVFAIERSYVGTS